MQKWMKRITLLLTALMLCLAGTGCRRDKPLSKPPYFGSAVSEWNPLVIYAKDGGQGDRTYFSRDPSLISMVVGVFDEMELEEIDSPAAADGISFTIDTTRGTVLLGRCDGKTLQRGSQAYTLKKDCEDELQRLFGLIQAETEGVTEVTQEQIRAVTPGMTWRELLDSFGKTLQTAVVGERTAFLYRFDFSRPFYITFDKETDTVGLTGEQLLESIGRQYNLSGILQTPQPLEGTRADAYIAAFRWAMKECRGYAATGIADLPYLDEAGTAAVEAALRTDIPAGSLWVEGFYFADEETLRLLIGGDGGYWADVTCRLENGHWTASGNKL